MWAQFVEMWNSITDPDPSEVIKSALGEIEREHDIKVIYACEAGSRAWNFNLPDSDYDVRFVYIRNPRDYMRINRGRDVIEYMSDDRMLDIVGWDVQKFLQLAAKKSNVSTYEWLMSPIEYKRDPRFPNLDNLKNRYSITKMYWHYWGLGKSLYDKFENGEISSKKVLYILRSWLCCCFIKQENEKPPIEIDELVLLCHIPASLRSEIRKLNDRRSGSTFDKSEYPKITEWIEQSNTELRDKSKLNLVEPVDKKVRTLSDTDLDTIFFTFIDTMERI